jgi:hypothetical protein
VTNRLCHCRSMGRSSNCNWTYTVICSSKIYVVYSAVLIPTKPPPYRYRATCACAPRPRVTFFESRPLYNAPLTPRRHAKLLPRMNARPTPRPPLAAGARGVVGRQPLGRREGESEKRPAPTTFSRSGHRNLPVPPLRGIGRGQRRGRLPTLVNAAGSESGSDASLAYKRRQGAHSALSQRTGTRAVCPCLQTAALV